MLPISESISPSIPSVTENIIPEPIQISEPVQREEPSLRVYSRRPRVTQQNQPSEPTSDPPQELQQEKSKVDDLDAPIAIRKGVRSCTQHPISKHLSYGRLSKNHRAFVSQLDDTTIPPKIHEALKDPKWKEAVFEELKALNENKTWEVVDMPKGKKLVGCKWIFTVKVGKNGIIERYKASLVA